MDKYVSKDALHETDSNCDIKSEETDIDNYPTSAVSTESFKKRLRSVARVYAYSDRLLSEIVNSIGGKDTTYMLFDCDGCLMKTWGEALPDKIGVMTMWTRETIGENAVTEGMEKDLTTSSKGEDHKIPELAGKTIYFSPLAARQTLEPFNMIKYGGVAIMVKNSSRSSAYTKVAYMLAHDLLLNLTFSTVANCIYERNGNGVIHIDPNIIKNQNTLTFVNKNIYKLFNLSDKDLTFEKVDSLIEPLPANAEFWALLDGSQSVSNAAMTLHVRGKAYQCEVSCDIHSTNYAPASDKSSFSYVVSINTMKEIYARVSKRLGNNAATTFDDIIGESAEIKSAISKAKLLSNTDCNLMILGESGVGKDVFARAIHNEGVRTGKPFVAVNCGALPRDLIASELFGYDGGAFTGAKREGHIGKFELANSGTIFLDEIGDLPYELQVVLLRSVETKQFTRLGGKQATVLDIRILSATNANMRELIDKKMFRSDLFYRLSGVQLYIPPLRERGKDILILAEHFARITSARLGRSSEIEFTDDAKAVLMKLPWEGNVRELQNTIESVVQLYHDTRITAEHIMENVYLQSRFYSNGGNDGGETGKIDSIVSRTDIDRQQRTGKTGLSREAILDALVQCNGNRSAAANYLNVARKTLYRNMEKWGIK